MFNMSPAHLTGKNNDDVVIETAVRRFEASAYDRTQLETLEEKMAAYIASLAAAENVINHFSN